MQATEEGPFCVRGDRQVALSPNAQHTDGSGAVAGLLCPTGKLSFVGGHHDNWFSGTILAKGCKMEASKGCLGAI